MKVNLENKVALVTGAARGIGEAIANTLAANGARVVRTDREASGAVVAMDVTDAGQVERVIADTVRRLGRLDILVNNAGVNTMAHRVNIDQFPLEKWERILKVDLTGVFNVTQAGAALFLHPHYLGGTGLGVSAVSEARDMNTAVDTMMTAARQCRHNP